MVPREVQLAGRDHEVAVDQIHQAVCQISWKVRAIVDAAVFLKAPRDKDAREALAQRELDIWIGLVITQQDVEAWLLRLDQVIFERQRLMLIGNDDILNVHRLAHQRAGLCVGLRGLQQIRTHPRPQALGLADVDHLSLGVLVEVHAGLSGQSTNFFLQIHRGVATR